jgi:hypothetical protein
MNANRRSVAAAILVAMLASACQAAASTPPSAPPVGTTAPAPSISTPTGAPATASPAATSAATAGPSVPAVSAAFVQFQPTAGSPSQVVGGATLVGVDDKTQVSIAVSSGSEKIAAAIQEGTCGNLRPEMAYRLTEVTSGASSTTVDVDLATLVDGDYAINLFVFGSETESSMACGNIEPLAAP